MRGAGEGALTTARWRFDGCDREGLLPYTAPRQHTHTRRGTRAQRTPDANSNRTTTHTTHAGVDTQGRHRVPTLTQGGTGRVSAPPATTPASAQARRVQKTRRRFRLRVALTAAHPQHGRSTTTFARAGCAPSQVLFRLFLRLELGCVRRVLALRRLGPVLGHLLVVLTLNVMPRFRSWVPLPRHSDLFEHF